MILNMEMDVDVHKMASIYDSDSTIKAKSTT